MNRLKQINISTMCNKMVDVLLPKGTTDKVLKLDLFICLDNYEEKDSFNISRNIELVFYAPNNYIKVGFRTDKNEKFIHVADHDSGWREGVSRSLEIIIEEIKDELIKNKYSAVRSQINFHTNFSGKGIELLENSKLVFEEKESRYEGFYTINKA